MFRKLKENIWYLPFFILLPFALIMGVLNLLLDKLLHKKPITEFEKRLEDLEFDRRYYENEAH